MCGITGFVGFDDSRLLRTMCDLLTHRGPDESGYHEAPNVGLAMRRLAIIDIAGGHQPISNEDGTIWVVFNGEIYNYEALRADLIRRGHTLATKSDTETIVHLYEEHGLDFVQHLRGMFGIALWDGPNRRLVLARDRIGEKPLFYAAARDGLVFGSEAKSVLAAIGKRTADAQSICDYLAIGYVAGTRTFYQGVSKLAPGQMLVFEDGRPTVHSYWTLDCRTFDDASIDEHTERLEAELEHAVQLCMKSDVEVAAFLSGGLDSSLLTALMTKQGVNVKTFSVGYGREASGFNELAYARQVSEHLGTDHHELILDAKSNLELLPKIIWHYDEPHGEPTSVLVYLLCEFVRRHVKVAVGGTGSDEIFYGYPRHKGLQYLRYYGLLPAILRKNVIAKVIDNIPESTRGSRFAKRARRFIAGAELPPYEAYLAWLRLMPSDVHATMLEGIAHDISDRTGLAGIRAAFRDSSSYDTTMGSATQIDVGGYLPEYQLGYMDRMSMANSLEVRSPFCDYRLVEQVVAMPPSHRLRRLESKYVLKRVAEKHLPKNIIYRKKVGFDSPIGEWMKGELRPFLESFLSREHVERSGMLDPDSVSQLMNEHLSGKRDYSLLLWSLLSLEIWHRMYIEDGVLDLNGYGLQQLRGAQPLR